MKRNHTLTGLLFIVCLLSGEAKGQSREEFNGPFKNWADVKKRFEARGNGKDDDTKALQAAIDNLGNQSTGYKMGENAYSVIYLPAGTYCISSTLVLKGKIGINIIGEDPERTVIKWTGGNKDTLLWANGSAYFRISRLSWDAAGRKDLEAIGIHWKDRWNDGKTRSYASLNIEISDCIFIGGFKEGISGGTYGGGEGTGSNDSEITIRRCVFRDCSFAGVEIEGYNALDYWIWDCKFLNCKIGVDGCFGNYHIYRSYFSGSTYSDVRNKNCYYTSVRGCYSEHSHGFSIDDGMSTNPFKRIFQDNTIVRPNRVPVEYYHYGKITLWGNKFARISDSTINCTIYTKCQAPGVAEVMSLHNIYADKKPIVINSSPNKIFTYRDEKGTTFKPDAGAFLRTLDPVPRKVNRKIFEVPPGTSTDSIQLMLNQAGQLKGQRPVVHFAMGTYLVGRTLEIPSGTDMQLMGDGLLYASMIRRSDGQFRKSPLLLIKGPSYISIRDLQIGSEGDKDQAAGIVFENVDQPHAQVHMDQVYSHADTSLLAEGLDHLYIQKDNSFFTDGNYITGGPLTQKKKGTARVCCFGGQFRQLTVLKNASFLAKDCWWEGRERVPLDLHGEGSISIDGAMIAPAGGDSTATIRIGKFNGSISLMNMYVQGALTCLPDNPKLDLLVWNIHFYHKMDVLDLLKNGASYRGAFLGLNAQCFRTNDPACADIITVKDQLQNVTDLNSFLEEQTTGSRTGRPLLFRELPAGVSNIYISRVSLGAMGRGIAFKS